MSVQEGVIRPPRLSENDQALYLLVNVAALLLIGPLTLFGGALLCAYLKLPHRKRDYFVSLGGGGGGLLLAYLNKQLLFSQYDGLRQDRLGLLSYRTLQSAF